MAMAGDDVATTAPASSAGSSPVTSESSLDPRLDSQSSVPDPRLECTASVQETCLTSKASGEISKVSGEESVPAVRAEFSNREVDDEDDEVAGIMKEAEQEKSNGSDSEADCESDVDSDLVSLGGEEIHEATKVQGPRKADEPNERILYDKCTIRTWFMSMDATGDGYISKWEFVNWLVHHPNMRKNFIMGEDDACNQDLSDTLQLARTTRRVLKWFKEVNVDKNTRIDFKEFLQFFRRGGYLLEYDDRHNPRANAEKILKRVSACGSVDVRSASQNARRTSECSWYMRQRQLAKQEMRRDHERTRRASSMASMGRSPASFWDHEPLLLKGDGGLQRRKTAWM